MSSPLGPFDSAVLGCFCGGDDLEKVGGERAKDKTKGNSQELFFGLRGTVRDDRLPKTAVAVAACRFIQEPTPIHTRQPTHTYIHTEGESGHEHRMNCTAFAPVLVGGVRHTPGTFFRWYKFCDLLREIAFCEGTSSSDDTILHSLLFGVLDNVFSALAVRRSASAFRFWTWVCSNPPTHQHMDISCCMQMCTWIQASEKPRKGGNLQKY